MALIERKISRKKQLALTGALLGIVLVTGGVAYFGLRDKTPAAPRPSTSSMTTGAVDLPQRSGVDALERIKTVDSYQTFKKFGDWPLSTEPRGRSAPFIVPQEEPNQ